MPGQFWTASAAMFQLMWLTMMVAMLPSLAPMLQRYRNAVGRRGEIHLGRLTTLVGAGYFFVWTVFGIAAFSLGVALAGIEMTELALARDVPIAVGVVVLLAGALQSTAWKAQHLTYCREDAKARPVCWPMPVRPGDSASTSSFPHATGISNTQEVKLHDGYETVDKHRDRMLLQPLPSGRGTQKLGMKGTYMKAYQIAAVALGVLLSLTASAQDRPPVRETGKVDPLPRDLETQLALSALPRHLRDNATVYVLNPAHGFEVARKGTNGFHGFVARIGDDTFRGSWPLRAYRDDILYPISFDEAGAKANMRVFFDAAEMQAKGTRPEELKKIIQERYKTHYYKPPERAGVSYMMSPILRTYVNPENNDDVCTTIVPHVMHYVPNVSPDAVGAATPAPEEMRYFCEHGHWRNNPDPFVIFHGAHGYMIQFLGVTERDAIHKEYQGTLERLCSIKKLWCLPE